MNQIINKSYLCYVQVCGWVDRLVSRWLTGWAGSGGVSMRAGRYGVVMGKCVVGAFLYSRASKNLRSPDLMKQLLAIRNGFAPVEPTCTGIPRRKAKVEHGRLVVI